MSTAGGPSFTPQLTLETWARGVIEKPVAIDRTGNYLHFAITPTSLPNMQDHTRNLVEEYLRIAVSKYYTHNTRSGCTNPASENFDFNANLDDSTCRPPATNFSFGGLYQMCTPDSYSNTEDLCISGRQPARQVNPLTGDFSCPLGYTAIQLHSGSVSHMTQRTVCDKDAGAVAFCGSALVATVTILIVPFEASLATKPSGAPLLTTHKFVRTKATSLVAITPRGLLTRHRFHVVSTHLLPTLCG